MLALSSAIPDLTPRQPFSAAANGDYLRMMTALHAADGDPARLSGPLALRYQHNLAQNIVKEKVFIAVSEAMRAGGVTAVYPIKGMHLLQTLYRDLPGIRPMVDIDLLVPRADFPKLPAIVRSRPSWRPDMERFLGLRARLAADIFFVTENTSVEVKRDLLLVPLVDFAPLFAAAGTTVVAGKEVPLLRPEHAAVLYLLHHLGDHLLHYRRIDPRHLAEFSVILRAIGDTAAFRDLCRSHRLERWYDLMLFLIYTFFEHPVVTAADFTVHPLFSCIGRTPNDTLGTAATTRLTAFLYGRWALPLLARNALLWLPKRALGRGR